MSGPPVVAMLGPPHREEPVRSRGFIGEEVEADGEDVVGLVWVWGSCECSLGFSSDVSSLIFSGFVVAEPIFSVSLGVIEVVIAVDEPFPTFLGTDA